MSTLDRGTILAMLSVSCEWESGAYFCRLSAFSRFCAGSHDATLSHTDYKSGLRCVQYLWGHLFMISSEQSWGVVTVSELSPAMCL